MSFIQAAFDHIIENAKKPEQWYVILVESYQAYGGGEEGGWYYSVNNLESYKEYPAKELAEKAAESVREFAKELQANSHREYGDLCLNQMEWLDARGLDADYLPENDGESHFTVDVVDELPVFSNERPHYE